ncbi:MAG: hypothetical protein KatS3mg102_1101 [Planctomycetota bacterium]|nr:MAG: hypothetical protein KatS3mg102_1101 [Planctomycetota bacterium]
MRRGLALLAAAALLAGGCGYRMGFRPVAGASAVALEVFDNTTDRRELELELTAAVARELLRRTGLALVRSPAEADLVLRGRIERFDERVTVEGRRDEVLAASARMRVRVRLERPGGELVRERVLEESADFGGPGLGGGPLARTAELAQVQRELFELLAERIVMVLEQ